jgi:hypothetical protein
MDFLSLSFRMAQSRQGAVFLPLAFGDCSDAEVAAISALFAPFVPEKVDSMYNNWEIWGYPIGGGGYSAKRSTWDSAKYFDDMAGLASFIFEYYDGRGEFGSPTYKPLI